MRKGISLFEMFSRYLDQVGREKWINYWVKRGKSEDEAARQWDEKLTTSDRDEISVCHFCSDLGAAGLIIVLLGVFAIGVYFLPVLWRIFIAGGLFFLAGGLLIYGKLRKRRTGE